MPIDPNRVSPRTNNTAITSSETVAEPQARTPSSPSREPALPSTSESTGARRYGGALRSSTTPRTPRLQTLLTRTKDVDLKLDSALAQDPIRTFQRTATGVEQVAFSGLAKLPHAPVNVTTKTVTRDKAIAVGKKAIETRELALADPTKAAAFPRTLPEDFSLRPSLYLMATPDTGKPEVSEGFIAGMADIGRVEGFSVLALRGSKVTTKVNDSDTLQSQKTTANLSPWTEDTGDVATDGSVSFSLEAVAGNTRMEILDQRTKRVANLNNSTASTVYFESIGAVAQFDEQLGKVAAAVVQGREVRCRITYIEGGDVVTGSRPDGTAFALIGRDTIAVNRESLSAELDQDLSEKETLAFLAKDLGVSPRQCFPVEQPHDFHLDMSLMLLSPGQVVLNDARAAAAQQIAWYRQDCAKQGTPVDDADIFIMRDRAEKVGAWEDLTAADLEAAGLKVSRMAGRFVTAGGKETMNFLNGECGTNANGERFLILMGGDERAETLVTKKLFTLEPKLDRLHLMPRDLTAPSLETLGGLGCRAKADGTVGP